VEISLKKDGYNIIEFPNLIMIRVICLWLKLKE